MTTPYEIKIAPPARGSFFGLSARYQKMIIKLIEALAINPRPPGARKIEGMIGLYSEEVDRLRIIYKIEEQEILVLLIKSEGSGAGRI